ILRQFFFSTYQFYLYQRLEEGNDEQLAAIAVKSLKEVTYHVRWSSEWVIRLGDGTDESHIRKNKAIEELWTYTGELFLPVDYEKEIGIDASDLKNKWLEKVNEIFNEATLAIPSINPVAANGKEGKH